MTPAPAYRPAFPEGPLPGIGIARRGDIVRKAHLPGYAAYGCNVVGVYDVRADAAAGLDVRVFRSLDELLDDPEIEIVDVATHPAARPGACPPSAGGRQARTGAKAARDRSRVRARAGRGG